MLPHRHVALPLGIGLAPMEGVTGFAMRLWFALCSAPDFMSTPFLRVTASYPTREWPRDFCPELFQLRGTLPYRLIPQIMATEASDALRTCDDFLRDVEFVDLNCGCPSPTCTGKGAGSSLLKEVDEFEAFVDHLARGVGPERLSVKMRTGYASDQEFPALLAALAGKRLARLTVHGRTRPQGYKGEARWDLIEQAASSLAVPVVASGDVVDGRSLDARRNEAPHVAGVIVGRGALRNPWIFSELRNHLAITIPFETVVLAVATYALLHELAATAPDALHALCKESVFAKACGTDPEAWRTAVRHVTRALYGRELDPTRAADRAAMPTARATLGRAKLIWNYVRSSLPPAYFAPQVMRGSSFESFVGALIALGPQDEKLTLSHRPDLDWLYSGGKNDASRAGTPGEGAACSA